MLLNRLSARARPALWDIDWYWGSSFPSGHTLAVTVFATAIVLCVSRIWPAWRNFSMSIAVLWIFLVAVSRLGTWCALANRCISGGVHWSVSATSNKCCT